MKAGSLTGCAPIGRPPRGGQRPLWPAGVDVPLVASTQVVGTRDEITELLATVARRVLGTVTLRHSAVRWPSSDRSWSFDLRTPDGIACKLVAAPTIDGPASSPGHYAITLMIVSPPGELTPQRARDVLSTALDVPFAATELARLAADMPLTVGLADMLDGQPLAGRSAIFTIHHMTDFLVLIEIAIRLGLRPDAITVVDKEYRYEHRNRVDAHLRDTLGVAVYRYRDLASAMETHFQRARLRGQATVILDDGGYVLPVLMEMRPDPDWLRTEVVGVVEQTASGIWRLAPYEGRIPVPIFSVAESDLKATVESYGVADACVRNMIRLLPNEKLEARDTGVLGFGRIGQEIARALRSRRMRVAIVDNDLSRLIAAREEGFVTYRDVGELFARHRPSFVVGCCGRGSVRAEHMRSIATNCYLVSTTSRDFEFDLAALRDLSTRQLPAPNVGTTYVLPDGAEVTVVADGFPVNFHRAESMPNRSSDIVLASMALGAAALCEDESAFVPGHNLALTNRVINSSALLTRYYDAYSR